MDTSTEACSVTLGLGERFFTLRSRQARSHALQLLPFVDALLQEHRLTAQALDFVACGRGPGSFTGLRIGLGVAQGLAYGLNIPLLGVCSLQALALTGLRAQATATESAVPAEPVTTLALLDARMGEVYWAAFESVGHASDVGSARGRLQQSVAPTLQSITDATASIASHLDERTHPAMLVGPGAALLSWSAEHADRIQAHHLPDSEAVAALALDDWHAGQRPGADRFELTYLRNSVSWNKRVRIRNAS